MPPCPRCSGCLCEDGQADVDLALAMVAGAGPALLKGCENLGTSAGEGNCCSDKKHLFTTHFGQSGTDGTALWELWVLFLRLPMLFQTARMMTRSLSCQSSCQSSSRRRYHATHVCSCATVPASCKPSIVQISCSAEAICVCARS